MASGARPLNGAIAHAKSRAAEGMAAGRRMIGNQTTAILRRRWVTAPLRAWRAAVTPAPRPAKLTRSVAFRLNLLRISRYRISDPPPKPPFRHGIPSDRRIGKRPPYRTKQVRLSRETQNGSCLGLNFGLWVESGRFCRPCKRQQSADCVEKLRKQNL